MRRIAIVLAVFLASCESYENRCVPGRRVECNCGGGEHGYQYCLDDGSGWSECRCGCQKDCAGKCCGDDGCGGTCPDDCPLGFSCDTACCECEADWKCETNQDCPAGFWCDRTVGECKVIECKPDCTGRCCGDDGCGGACPDNCPVGYVCDPLTCACGPEEQQCCPGTPAGVYYIDVEGTVVDVAANIGVRVALAPISPLDALTNPNPFHLDELVSGAGGAFETDCFDVTEVALGCIMLADDIGFDGVAGDYFPAGTFLVDWSINGEKQCVEDARVFAVSNLLVVALDRLPDLDSAGEGFVMGLVMDRRGNPVPGAVVVLSDGSDLDRVYYPDAAFTDLVTATATSANGVFILPGGNFSAGIINIAAEKSGMSFPTVHVVSRPGFCLFVLLGEET